MRLKPPSSSLHGYFALLGVSALTIASFWSLDIQLYKLFSFRSLELMGKFFGELLVPNLSGAFLIKVLYASLETLAMSAVGTLIAALLGIVIALPASKTSSNDPIYYRAITRWILNLLRSIPELIWAALLLISVGLGPFAGTLALALHTTGVLGRLFAEAIENAPTQPGDTLRIMGVGELKIFLYATLPSILPQLISYTLYRWENNIRAAAVLGVVGGGGLGQMLAFHMGLFQMQDTSTILIAMISLVMLVDGFSYLLRRHLDR
jgi:phosphonate transport system permease protein